MGHLLITSLVGLALVSACGNDRSTRGPSGSTADGGGPSVDAGPGASQGPALNDRAEVPSARPSTSALLAEVLTACERVIADAERQVVDRCAFNADTVPIVDLFAQMHADAIARRPLPGRGLEAFALPPGEITLAGDAIEVLSCTSNPLCMPGATCPTMNAFALTNLVITIDPLLASFAEGAAYWGRLRNDAGGDASLVDPVELYEGLGRIYASHGRGAGWAEVDQATVVGMLESDEFVYEMWAGATAFLIFHEIGHADLDHGLINHTAATGPRAVLAAEGRTLSDEENRQLEEELRTLKVFTETQADIYSATLLRESGFTSDGPVVLFTAAMSAYLVASGMCAHARDQTELYDCALASHPQASHPPLDVRATVLRRIVDDGEDLTGLLVLE